MSSFTYILYPFVFSFLWEGTDSVKGGNARVSDGNQTTTTTAAAAEKRARNPTRTINLEEFTFHACPRDGSPCGLSSTNDDDESELQGYYTHPCRCSAVYRITLDQLEEGVDVVGCEGCGEWVGVGYMVVEDGSEGSGGGERSGS